MKRKIQFSNIQSQKLSLRSKATTIVGGSMLLAAVVTVAVLQYSDGTGKLRGYEWRKAITINDDQITGEDLFSNFPIYVSIKDSNLKHISFGGKIQHPDGHDIRFCKGDGATLLSHRIIEYDGLQGELKGWVNVDTLQKTNYNLIYIYYGNKDPNLPKDHLVSTMDLQGHFILGGDENDLERNSKYSHNWLQIEQANQKNPKNFIRLGEEEYLPMEFSARYASLEAKIIANKAIMLSWSTESEQDNKLFFVERSNNGKQFESLVKRGAGGNSNYLLRYTFADPKPKAGKNYYRIKQVDKDGDFSFSPLIEVDFGEVGKSISVNHVEIDSTERKISIYYALDESSEVEFNFYTENGEILHVQKFRESKGTNLYSFNYEQELGEGVYVLTIIAADRKPTFIRITKEKNKSLQVSDLPI